MTPLHPRHVGGRSNDLLSPLNGLAGTHSAEPSTSDLPAGGTVDELLASRAVASGDVTAAVTITMRGEVDVAALERISELLEDLVKTRSVVVADLYQAQCRTGRLLAVPTEFRARRRGLELETRLHGLHPGVIPNIETADLTEVFDAYRDSRRSSYPNEVRGRAGRW